MSTQIYKGSLFPDVYTDAPLSSYNPEEQSKSTIKVLEAYMRKQDELLERSNFIVKAHTAAYMAARRVQQLQHAKVVYKYTFP